MEATFVLLSFSFYFLSFLCSKMNLIMSPHSPDSERPVPLFSLRSMRVPRKKSPTSTHAAAFDSSEKY